MAVMEVVLQQTYAGQETVNRWNYVSSGTPASVSLSFALINAMGGIYDAAGTPVGYPATRIMKLLAACQSSGVTFDLLYARDVYSTTDFYESPFVQPLVGAKSGEAMPPFVAFGYRTNRVRTDVRRGTKRFVGLLESDNASLGTLLPAFVTGVGAALRTAMSAVLTYDDEGNTISFNPCVCGKEKYVPDPAHPEKTAYKYYASQATQLSHTALGIQWDIYNTVRSQTSRQYGRGR